MCASWWSINSWCGREHGCFLCLNKQCLIHAAMFIISLVESMDALCWHTVVVPAQYIRANKWYVELYIIRNLYFECASYIFVFIFYFFGKYITQARF